MCEDCPIQISYFELKLAVEVLLRQDFKENFLPPERRELLLHYLEEVQKSERVPLSKMQVFQFRRSRLHEECVEVEEPRGESSNSELSGLLCKGGQA